MEFLQARARRIGYKVFVDGDTLHFRKGDATAGDGPELGFGRLLREFHPRLSAAHQSDKVVVRSWDPVEKAAINSEVGLNNGLNQGGMTQNGGATTQKAFGSATAMVVDQPLFSVDEATALATGLANDISIEFIQAEGECYGHPQLTAGKTIKITDLGKRFSGKYFVTAATHVFNAQGYITTFTL
jgi:phage protein D